MNGLTLQQLIDKLEEMKEYHSPSSPVYIDTDGESIIGFIRITDVYTFGQNEIGLEIKD